MKRRPQMPRKIQVIWGAGGMSGQEINHEPIPVARKIVATLSVVIALVFLIYFFVICQWALVVDEWAFALVLAILLLASFFSTLMEAAFSAAFDPKDPSNRKLRTMIIRAAEARNDLSVAIGTRTMTADEEKSLKRIIRREGNLKKIDRARSGIDRNLYVGALATLSVFLNTSLAVFLPVALVQTPVSEVITMPFLNFSYSPETGFVYGWEEIDITSVRVFVLCAATIPVLLFGKVIPKVLGREFAAVCIAKFGWLAQVTKFSLGWITLGLTWFIPQSS